MNKKLFNLLIVCLAIWGVTWKVYAKEVNDNTIDNKAGVYTLSSNNENNYSVVLEDDANLLTDGQKQKLKEQMMELSKDGNVIFKSIDRNNLRNAANFARNYYHEQFGNASGVLLLIDMDTREIYIFSDGKIHNTITNAKAYSITDNVYKYATNGNYYSCAADAFNQIGALLEGKRIAEPMRNASNVVIAITLAFLINFLYVLFKSRMKKADAEEIIKNCNINFKVGNVNAVKDGTSRVYSPVSSDSSGDSSYGGSSSGGSFGGGGGFHSSSGGGGGHRF